MTRNHVRRREKPHEKNRNAVTAILAIAVAITAASLFLIFENDQDDEDENWSLAAPGDIGYSFSTTSANGGQLRYYVTSNSVVSLVYGYNLSGFLSIPSYVSDPAGNSYTVTYVDENAFNDCVNLTSVTIPSTITYIGSGAFGGCTGLTSVTIPSTVTSIGSEAFRGCTILTSITVNPSNSYYSSDSNGVLFNKNGTTLIHYPGGKVGHYVVPSTVTLIEQYAFRGCTNITSIDLNSVSSIGSYAFGGCTGLVSVDLGAVQTIESNAFRGCTNLSNINLGSVREIWDWAFYGCTNLSNINLSSVTVVRSYVFYGCTNITSIDLNSVSSIESGAFYGCTNLTSVTTSDSIEFIWRYAFDHNLTAIALPYGATIESWAISDYTMIIRYDGVKSVTVIDKGGVIGVEIEAYDYYNGVVTLEAIPSQNTAISNITVKLNNTVIASESNGLISFPADSINSGDNLYGEITFLDTRGSYGGGGGSLGNFDIDPMTFAIMAIVGIGGIGALIFLIKRT